MAYLFNFLIMIVMISIIISGVGWLDFKSVILFKISKEKTLLVKILSIIASLLTWCNFLIGLLNLSKFIFNF